MRMTDDIPTTYTVQAEHPDTGTAVIRAQVKEADVAAEVDRMAREGLCNIRVAATRNPAGNAG